MAQNSKLSSSFKNDLNLKKLAAPVNTAENGTNEPHS